MRTCADDAVVSSRPGRECDRAQLSSAHHGAAAGGAGSRGVPAVFRGLWAGGGSDGGVGGGRKVTGR